MTRFPYAIAFVLVLGLATADSHAATVLVGTLSYDTFIPGSPVSPGIDAFNLSNLTGSFDLPPDFPVSDSLVFASASLVLTFGDLTHETLALGDIGPGFLLDGSGNPVVQVPGDQVFVSAEFTATLSPLSFALSDGSIFTADSSSVDVLLQPSSGPTLVADTDQTTIAVPGTYAAIAVTPEPSGCALVLTGVTWLAVCVYRKRASRMG